VNPSPPAGSPSSPDPAPGRYPVELERNWQPAGRPVVRIRPLRPDDGELEVQFVKRLSPQTRYLRTQYSASEPTPADIERLLDLDYDERLAVTALVADEVAERIVGVSRYARIEASTRAECAVVVADDWQGVGLGTELMRSLAQAAVARGYTTLEGTTLAENSRLVAWARRLGFDVRTEPDSRGELRVTIQLQGLTPVD
jgi:acetyltransferase